MFKVKENSGPEQAAWRFYLSPRETWAAMLEDIAAAKKSVIVEQYIFHNDEVGQEFMRLFTQKAGEGVHVRLLCDDIGSGSFHGSPLIEAFRARGGIFHFYNSLKLADIFKPRQIFPRTHLKAMAVDTEVAYMGGVCIAQRMAGWRDTHIRVTGPVVEQVQEALDRNSQEVLGVRANRNQREARPVAHADAAFAYVQNDPAFLRHPIYAALLHHISGARDYIYISAAFFVPTRRLRRYLKRAAARGVEVVVLIPEMSDSSLADWACLSYLSRLIKGGVRIYRYHPSVLHTKTVVVDGKWGMVGSCNMDPLSFFHNREANLVVKDVEALAEMRRDFKNDLGNSRQMTMTLLRQIPLWKRFAAHFARFFRSIL